MSVLKIARSAAAIAAATMLPAHAIASAPAGMTVAAGSIAAVQQDEAGADEGHPFFKSEFLIPTVIVIVLALGLYFVLEDGEDDEDGGPGPSPITP